MNWDELLLISATIKTGLFGSLAKKKRDAEEIAKEKKYDLRAVKIVLDALVEIGLLKKEKDRYALTAEAAVFVDEKHPFFKANSILHQARLVENWTNLDKAIITGKSQTRRRSDEELEIFVRSMDEMNKVAAKQIASLIIKTHPKAKNALDLGGASGTHTKQLLALGLEVTLVDTPAVIEITEKYMKDTGANLVGEDFTQSLPKGKFDVILLSNIAHIYKPEKLIRLFSDIENALASGGIVVIVDFVRGKSKRAAMFAVNMLVHTAGGGTWTLEQYKSWLESSSLKVESVEALKNSDQQAIIARKKKS